MAKSRNTSAGTLVVGLAAPTEQFDADMKRAAATTKKFESTTVSSNQVIVKSWEASNKAARKFAGSAEKFGAGMGRMAAGLAMMSGAANDTASTVGGALTRSMGAFLVGGPAALGFVAVTEAVSLFGRASKKSHDDAAAAADRHLKKLKELQGWTENKWSGLERRDLDKRAKSMGVDPGMLGEREATERQLRDSESAMARLAGRIAQTRRDLASAEANRDRALSSGARGVADHWEDKRKELLDRLSMLAAESRAHGEAIHTAREALAALAEDEEKYQQERAQAVNQQNDDIAKRSGEATEKVLAAQRKREEDHLAEVRKAYEAHSEDLAKMQARALERQERERAHRSVRNNETNLEAQEKERDAVADINASLERRLQTMTRTTDRERLALQQYYEMVDLMERGGNIETLRRIHAHEMLTLTEKEAAAKREVAREAANALLAEERITREKEAHAELDRRAEQAQARANQLNTYGAGDGPLAQARDAKRRDRNIAKNKRTEANLAAEARESMAYGTVGAPRYDENGAPIGVADPWASDLGSLYNQHQRPLPPVAFNAAPSNPNHALPEDPGYWDGYANKGGGAPPAAPAMPDLAPAAAAMGGAGASADSAAKATEDAAGKVADGAGKVAAAAQGISTTTSSIGAAVVSIAEMIESVKGDLDALKEQFAAQGFFGG